MKSPDWVKVVFPRSREIDEPFTIPVPENARPDRSETVDGITTDLSPEQ
jgi:hypothetical protein